MAAPKTSVSSGGKSRTRSRHCWMSSRDFDAWIRSGPRYDVSQLRFSIRLGPRMMDQAHAGRTESVFMIDRFPCPKCGRRLERSGEIQFDGIAYPVFQCDECLVETEMFGEPIEVALTFAVNEDGRPFDPATDSGELSI